MKKTAAACALGAMLGFLPPLYARAAEVVASIKPIHSLVAAIMAGAGTPHLIVKGAASPHTYSLKPSDAAALQNAQAVFWVGENLEGFLEGPLEALSGKAQIVELMNAPGLKRLAYREGGPWEKHAHADEGEQGHGHDEHEHEKGKHGDDHDHAQRGEKGHDHDEHGHEDAKHGGDHDHAGHDHEDMDVHVWLNPANAKVIVGEIVETLKKADPANAGIYEANGKELAGRLDSLQLSLEEELASVKGKPFIVFHDAYQYLEEAFALNAAGSVTVSPDKQPGAKRIAEIRGKVEKLSAGCVFSEPQFEPRVLKVIVEGTKAKTGVLDPLGADIADGPELYFRLMERNARALRTCLSESS